jgi:Beta-lactamase class A
MPDMHALRRARRGLAAAAAAGSALAALFAATPAQASTADATSEATATVGGSQVKCTSQRPGLAARLSKDIAGALHGRDHAAALALYDRATGTSCDFRADTAFDSASVVKVTILGALLRQSMEQHRALTAHEVELTTAMITKSDNDATNALWHQIGHAGIQHFLTLAGMGDTVPGPKGYWGHTQVTAEDQLRLLRLLTSDNSVLDRDARTYALRLMNRVVPEQRWGTPAGPPRRRPSRSRTAGCRATPTAGGCTASVCSPAAATTTEWSCSPRTTARWPTASRPSRAPPMP